MIPLIFEKAGKYKSGNKVIEVTEHDVKHKKIIGVDGKNANNFVKVGKARFADTKQEKPKQVEQKETPKKETSKKPDDKKE